MYTNKGEIQMIQKFYSEKVIGMCSCGVISFVKSARYAIGDVTAVYDYRLVDVWRCPACRQFSHSFYYPNFEKLFEKSFIGA